MSTHSAHPTAERRQEPQPYCDFWQGRGPTRLILSSIDRGWSGLSAELRAHGKSEIPWRGTQSDTEICVDVHGNGSPVTRRATGVSDRTITRRDTIWLTPAGWKEGSLDIGGDLPGIAHIYLDPSQFSPGKLGVEVDASALGALRYDSAFEDPLLGEMARAIASELQSETSAGRLLVESLASSMAIRLIQKYTSSPAARPAAVSASGGLDRRRLSRVLDYIEANLEGDLSLDRIASIAYLSRFHFARAFRQAVGHPPHRYVAARRLERAKALLIQGDRPLVDIALTLGFSNQANFTRAFKQAAGMAPGQYRRGSGLPQPAMSLADIRDAIPILA
ncbi:helix-turn-helix domain-containing protein [Bradyrhizobium tropiciagri]|uniref:helix-turn-helix domain-containing protein n=1 Tax=Bradyrhizobium tropiciagri TaxID=312253 RepID=UPI000B01DAA1|nr:AraC family transcriptional regulator [Bradyrhizobium tropiciagri]